MPSPALHASLLLSTSPNYTTKANNPTLYTYTVHNLQQPSAFTLLSLFNPNWFSPHGLSDMAPIWELWQDLPWTGAQLPPANTQSHSVCWLSVSPAMCWQSTCKSHHPWDTANFPWQVPPGKFKWEIPMQQLFLLFMWKWGGQKHQGNCTRNTGLGALAAYVTWNTHLCFMGRMSLWSKAITWESIPRSMSSFLFYCQWDTDPHLKQFKTINPLNGVFCKNTHVKNLEAQEEHTSAVHPQSPSGGKP